MKTFKILLSWIALGTLITACDDESTANPYHKMSDFEIACTVTGGTPASDQKCKCGKQYCDTGEVCNYTTNECPEKSLPEFCAKESTTCTNSVFYTCNASNQFVKWTDCEYGCLPDHSDCAECAADRCEKGMLTQCVKGVYQNIISCELNECASPTACRKECEEQDRICKDGKIQICEDEHFRVEKTCEYGCDKKTGNTCASGCEDGSSLCTNGQVKICSDGRYSEPQPCPNNYSCTNNDTECGECTNGTVYCVDNPTTQIGYFRACRNGKLAEEDPTFECNGKHSCNPETNSCGVCKNGEHRCVTDETTKIGHVQICEKGKFVEDYTCPNDFSCKSDTACGDCLNDTQTCTNDDNQIGTEHKCINGIIYSYPCNENNSCNNTTNACGECNNTYLKCSTVNVGDMTYCENGKVQLYKCQERYPDRPYCKPGESECRKNQ